MRRREFIAGIAWAALSWPLKVARAQDRHRRIGFLGTATPSGYKSLVDSFRAGLAQLGWEEGKNITLEYRWAEGKYDQLAVLASELIRLNVDILVTHGTPGTMALQKATREIPIVMTVSGDAVGSGLIESFARPGGNTTGQSFLAPQISAKRLELLKEAIPSLTRIATVFNEANPSARSDLQALAETAKALSVDFRPFPVQGPESFDNVFSSIAEAGFHAVSLIHDAVLTANVSRLAKLAIQHRLPSIGEGPYVKVGGLIGYGPDFNELWRSAASYVDRILKGARPADLPIQLPTKFEFMLNQKTARLLALDIPPTLLARADEVIE